MKSSSQNANEVQDIKRRFANKSLQNIKIYYYPTTDSTNTRAKEAARVKHATLPAVFIAKEQTAGRGRMGRRFESPDGAGLYISFLFHPEKEEKDAGLITAFAAVRAARAIESVCKIEIGIKWVNDLTVNGKKLAGILTEGEYDENGAFKYAVCGIGINLKDGALSPELDGIATNIEKECGAKVDEIELAAKLIEEFFATREQAELLEEYRSRSTVLNKQITVHPILSEPYEALAVAISDTAELIVEKDGKQITLSSAEVSIRKY